MKQKLTTTLLFLLTLTVAAQTQEKQITVTENVAYRTDVGPSTVLDLAQPTFGPQQNRPAILIIHGGGWSAGSKNDMVYRTLMIDYAMKGYVVANMNYRLTQEAPLPACIEDVRCAIRWMKANAQKLGIDPNRIGTYGHSAGGHLSLMAGVAADSKAFADDKDPWKQFDCSVACAAGGAPPTEIGRAGEWADHTEWWPIGYIGKSQTPFLVLQGGEDGYFTDEVLCGIVSEIRFRYPDCAITLSLGERSRESYRRLLEAGANRYLLRHETADERHYARLHPPELTLEHRKECLYALRELGYQTGAGFMVGSPYQTVGNLADDLLFIRELQPQMCGIGPFIPHHDTPFRDFAAGSLRMTLMLLSIIRLMNPRILLPATTALGTIAPKGRELGVLHGANVVMPNLSPLEHRKDYSLYDNKLCTGDEAAECIRCLSGRMKTIGYEIVTDRGDYK